jgi:hypothetical protein
VTLEETASTGNRTDQELTLTTPQQLVSDPAVVYPITIDPDVSQLLPEQDTWVREGTTWIEGTYRLLVGRLGDSPNNNPAISYVQFPSMKGAGGTQDDRITGRKISDAKLHLFQYAAGSCSSRRMNIHPLSTSWNKTTTLYANKPPARTDTAASTYLTKNVGGDGCSTSNGFITADVTKMVQAWADGPSQGLPNYGLQLNVPSDDANDTSFERRFCSMNFDPSHTSCTSAARSPYLSFSYTVTPPPEPPQSVTLIAPAATSPSLVTTRAVSSWKATVLFPASSPGCAPGPTDCLAIAYSINNSSGATVASGTSVPASPGKTITWDTPSLGDGTYTMTLRTS